MSIWAQTAKEKCLFISGLGEGRGQYLGVAQLYTCRNLMQADFIIVFVIGVLPVTPFFLLLFLRPILPVSRLSGVEIVMLLLP